MYLLTQMANIYIFIYFVNFNVYLIGFYYDKMIADCNTLLLNLYVNKLHLKNGNCNM